MLLVMALLCKTNFNFKKRFVILCVEYNFNTCNIVQEFTIFYFLLLNDGNVIYIYIVQKPMVRVLRRENVLLLLNNNYNRHTYIV